MICKTCRDTGKILARRPTIYCTDSDDEIQDAYEMASRMCPDCKGQTPEQQIVKLTAERDAEKQRAEEIEAIVVRRELPGHGRVRWSSAADCEGITGGAGPAGG